MMYNKVLDNLIDSSSRKVIDLRNASSISINDKFNNKNDETKDVSVVLNLEKIDLWNTSHISAFFDNCNLKIPIEIETEKMKFKAWYSLESLWRDFDKKFEEEIEKNKKIEEKNSSKRKNSSTPQRKMSTASNFSSTLTPSRPTSASTSSLLTSKPKFTYKTMQDAGLNLPQYIEDINSIMMNGCQLLSFHKDLLPFNLSQKKDKTDKNKSNSSKNLSDWNWQNFFHELKLNSHIANLRVYFYFLMTRELLCENDSISNEKSLRNPYNWKSGHLSRWLLGLYGKEYIDETISKKKNSKKDKKKSKKNDVYDDSSSDDSDETDEDSIENDEELIIVPSEEKKNSLNNNIEMVTLSSLLCLRFRWRFIDLVDYINYISSPTSSLVPILHGWNLLEQSEKDLIIKAVKDLDSKFIRPLTEEEKKRQLLEEEQKKKDLELKLLKEMEEDLKKVEDEKRKKILEEEEEKKKMKLEKKKELKLQEELQTEEERKRKEDELKKENEKKYLETLKSQIFEDEKNKILNKIDKEEEEKLKLKKLLKKEEKEKEKEKVCSKEIQVEHERENDGYKVSEFDKIVEKNSPKSKPSNESKTLIKLNKKLLELIPNYQSLNLLEDRQDVLIDHLNLLANHCYQQNSMINNLTEKINEIQKSTFKDLENHSNILKNLVLNSNQQEELINTLSRHNKGNNKTLESSSSFTSLLPSSPPSSSSSSALSTSLILPPASPTKLIPVPPPSYLSEDEDENSQGEDDPLLNPSNFIKSPLDIVNNILNLTEKDKKKDEELSYEELINESVLKNLYIMKYLFLKYQFKYDEKEYNKGKNEKNKKNNDKSLDIFNNTNNNLLNSTLESLPPSTPLKSNSILKDDKNKNNINNKEIKETTFSDNIISSSSATSTFLDSSNLPQDTASIISLLLIRWTRIGRLILYDYQKYKNMLKEDPKKSNQIVFGNVTVLDLYLSIKNLKIYIKILWLNLIKDVANSYISSTTSISSTNSSKKLNFLNQFDSNNFVLSYNNECFLIFYIFQYYIKNILKIYHDFYPISSSSSINYQNDNFIEETLNELIELFKNSHSKNNYKDKIKDKNNKDMKLKLKLYNNFLSYSTYSSYSLDSINFQFLSSFFFNSSTSSNSSTSNSQTNTSLPVNSTYILTRTDFRQILLECLKLNISWSNFDQLFYYFDKKKTNNIYPLNSLQNLLENNSFYDCFLNILNKYYINLYKDLYSVSIRNNIKILNFPYQLSLNNQLNSLISSSNSSNINSTTSYFVTNPLSSLPSFIIDTNLFFILNNFILMLLTNILINTKLLSLNYSSSNSASSSNSSLNPKNFLLEYIIKNKFQFNSFQYFLNQNLTNSSLEQVDEDSILQYQNFIGDLIYSLTSSLINEYKFLYYYDTKEFLHQMKSNLPDYLFQFFDKDDQDIEEIDEKNDNLYNEDDLDEKELERKILKNMKNYNKKINNMKKENFEKQFSTYNTNYDNNDENNSNSSLPDSSNSSSSSSYTNFTSQSLEFSHIINTLLPLLPIIFNNYHDLCHCVAKNLNIYNDFSSLILKNFEKLLNLYILTRFNSEIFLNMNENSLELFYDQFKSDEVRKEEKLKNLNKDEEGDTIFYNNIDFNNYIINYNKIHSNFFNLDFFYTKKSPTQTANALMSTKTEASKEIQLSSPTSNSIPNSSNNFTPSSQLPSSHTSILSSNPLKSNLDDFLSYNTHLTSYKSSQSLLKNELILTELLGYPLLSITQNSYNLEDIFNKNSKKNKIQEILHTKTWPNDIIPLHCLLIHLNTIHINLLNYYKNYHTVLDEYIEKVGDNDEDDDEDNEKLFNNSSNNNIKKETFLNRINDSIRKNQIYSLNSTKNLINSIQNSKFSYQYLKKSIKNYKLNTKKLKNKNFLKISKELQEEYELTENNKKNYTKRYKTEKIYKNEKNYNNVSKYNNNNDLDDEERLQRIRESISFNLSKKYY